MSVGDVSAAGAAVVERAVGVVVGITALTLVLSAGLGARQRVMERVEKFGAASLEEAFLKIARKV